MKKLNKPVFVAYEVQEEQVYAYEHASWSSLFIC